MKIDKEDVAEIIQLANYKPLVPFELVGIALNLCMKYNMKYNIEGVSVATTGIQLLRKQCLKQFSEEELLEYLI